MKYRLVSDIHSEFFRDYFEDDLEKQMLEILPPLPDDAMSILILAGDIGAMSAPEALEAVLRMYAARFLRVYYIPGNHEFYSGDLGTTPDFIEDMVERINGKFPFDKDGMFTHRIFFTKSCTKYRTGIGADVNACTLWTDFDKENPVSMWEAGQRMNDYRLITNGRFTATPAHMLEEHKKHKMALESNIQEGDIVVTHHSPSLQSIPDAYKTDRVNGAYHSDLDELILRKKPALWCHGHTHDAFDYMIGETRILCNPRGYGNQYKKNGYNPTLVVEL